MMALRARLLARGELAGIRTLALQLALDDASTTADGGSRGTAADVDDMACVLKKLRASGSELAKSVPRKAARRIGAVAEV